MKPNKSEATGLRDLVDNLDFMPENVVGTAATQPSLFMQAIDFRVRCYRAVLAAKARLEQAKAEYELRLRQAARENGDKITESHVAAKITVSPRVIGALEEFHKAEVEDEQARGLVQAYQHRRDCLKVIGELVGKELAMQQVVSAQQTEIREHKRRLNEKYANRK